MTRRNSLFPTLAALAAILAGCAPKEQARQKTPPEQPKLYQLRGEVIRLDPQSNLASIHNERIEGWMEPMTMEYPVENPNEYKALRPGEQITATVNVTSDGFWLTNVKERKKEGK